VKVEGIEEQFYNNFKKTLNNRLIDEFNKRLISAKKDSKFLIHYFCFTVIEIIFNMFNSLTAKK
jgi:hypothetical protein